MHSRPGPIDQLHVSNTTATGLLGFWPDLYYFTLPIMSL